MARPPDKEEKAMLLSEVRNQDFILREKGSAGREIFDGILAAQELNVRPIWQSP